MSKLKLTEIFFSLQGETRTVGLPTVFIRLTGCPLRCQYCDTQYAFYGGTWYTFDEILEKVASFNARYVTVTGGEPLAQAACIDLLKLLCDKNYNVSLETSGALDVSKVDSRVTKILDLKTPASLEMKKNRLENIEYLNPHDEVKFVICDRNDYEWAKQMIQQFDLTSRCDVLFSAAWGQAPQGSDSKRDPKINPGLLADWILEDKLNIRFQLQLHKVLWGDQPGK